MCNGTDESAGYHKIDGRKWRNRIGGFAAVLQSFLGTEDSAVASHRGSHMKNHVCVEEDNIGNVNGFVLHTCAHTCASSALMRMQMTISSASVAFACMYL